MFATTKKKHFLQKLEAVQAQIWDREFQKHQALEMRESIRMERDRANEAADAFKVELAKDHKEETKADLQKKYDLAKSNADRFTAQIQMLDNEVNGKPYVPAIPAHKNDAGELVPEVPAQDGMQGLNDVVASLNEVRKMFISYIKTL